MVGVEHALAVLDLGCGQAPQGGDRLEQPVLKPAVGGLEDAAVRHRLDRQDDVPVPLGADLRHRAPGRPRVKGRDLSIEPSRRSEGSQDAIDRTDDVWTEGVRGRSSPVLPHLVMVGRTLVEVVDAAGDAVGKPMYELRGDPVLGRAHVVAGDTDLTEDRVHDVGAHRHVELVNHRRDHPTAQVRFGQDGVDVGGAHGGAATAPELTAAARIRGEVRSG